MAPTAKQRRGAYAKEFSFNEVMVKQSGLGSSGKLITPPLKRDSLENTGHLSSDLKDMPRIEEKREAQSYSDSRSETDWDMQTSMPPQPAGSNIFGFKKQQTMGQTRPEAIENFENFNYGDQELEVIRK